MAECHIARSCAYIPSIIFSCSSDGVKPLARVALSQGRDSGSSCGNLRAMSVHHSPMFSSLYISVASSCRMSTAGFMCRSQYWSSATRLRKSSNATPDQPYRQADSRRGTGWRTMAKRLLTLSDSLRGRFGGWFNTSRMVIDPHFGTPRYAKS